ncbi:MAG TPA: TPM domain-containing protein [Candidatus Krumholzibacteria bacterium]|nr:TPM domain-containing protein [Candidatus Krumholzibacteria bacterium]
MRMRTTTYRSLATFLVTAGIVLIALAAGLALREMVIPSTDTWPAWTSGTIVVLTLLAALLWLLGAVLSRGAHRRRRDTVPTFLTAAERERVVASIRKFENRTSGEIRVHLEGRIDGSATDAARRVFDRLGMARTRDRNGVLFLVGVRDRRFAVIGDAGINEVVARDFWPGVVARVEACFAVGRYADGLAEGIELAGTALVEFFPPRPDDVNELPDDISGQPS